MTTRKPVGTCPHRPVSNGWSQHWNHETGLHPAVAWCGYCRATVEMDDEWVAKMAASGRTAPRAVDPLRHLVGEQVLA